MGRGDIRRQTVQVQIEKDIARALYERLLKPSKDSDGNTVYTISLTLAGELRDALFPALEGK